MTRMSSGPVSSSTLTSAVKMCIRDSYVVDAPDLDAALVIARQNPIHHQGGGVEVRPVEGSWIRPL